MKLKYLFLFMQTEKTNKASRDFSGLFSLQTRMLCHYVASYMRKQKYELPFRDINIRALSESADATFEEEVKNMMSVDIRFKKEDYQKINPDDEISLNNYFAKLLEQALQEVNSHQEIPLNGFMSAIDEFKKNGYKNQWLSKKKLFKDVNLRVFLDCKLTTKKFQLTLKLENIKSKELLFSTTALQTPPDEIFWKKMLKDIQVEDGYLYLVDFLDQRYYQLELTNFQEQRLDHYIYNSWVD